MPNSYYNKVFDVLPASKIASQAIEDEFARIEVGFDTVTASTALTGTPTAPTASTPTSTTQIATTEFAHNLMDANLATMAADVAATAADRVQTGLDRVQTGLDRAAAAASAAALTGPISTIDINGGTIDGTVIGGTTPAAATITSLNSGPLAGFRNRIINGDMRVAQRTPGNADYVYCVDRWRSSKVGAGGATSATLTWSQSTESSATVGDYSFNALTLTTSVWTGGYLQVYIRQPIESKNCSDLAGKTVTLSSWVRQTSGLDVTFAPSVNVYATTDVDSSGYGLTSTDSDTVVPSGVWTRLTHRFAIPTDATKGMAPLYLATLNTGSCAISFAKVQLEIGSTATPFEARPYGVELALCQRYYEQTDYLTGITGHRTLVASSASTAQGFAFLVPKRIAPTVVLYGRTNVASRVTSNVTGTATANNTTASGISTQGVGYLTETGNGFTAGVGYEAHYTASAEL